MSTRLYGGSTCWATREKTGMSSPHTIATVKCSAFIASMGIDNGWIQSTSRLRDWCASKMIMLLRNLWVCLRRLSLSQILMRPFLGEQARRLARKGSLSSRVLHTHPWWPEDLCAQIEKITWVVSGLDEPGACWQKFVAYDASGKLLGTHRVEEK